jgi:hypothetical protein
VEQEGDTKKQVSLVRGTTAVREEGWWPEAVLTEAQASL